MGLNWFRASLSMEEEASKVDTMTGMYRKISFFEPKDVEISAAPPSVASDSISSEETAEYDRSKADLTSQTSSTIDLEEMTVKDTDKKSKINNHAVENTEPPTSNKDPNVNEQSGERDEESNKITKDQNDTPVTESPICSDNELVI